MEVVLRAMQHCIVYSAAGGSQDSCQVTNAASVTVISARCTIPARVDQRHLNSPLPRLLRQTHPLTLHKEFWIHVHVTQVQSCSRLWYIGNPMGIAEMSSINRTEVVSGDASNTALATDWSPVTPVRYVTADRLVGVYWSGSGIRGSRFFFSSIFELVVTFFKP